jgi:hypothetical protein
VATSVQAKKVDELEALGQRFPFLGDLPRPDVHLQLQQSNRSVQNVLDAQAAAEAAQRELAASQTLAEVAASGNELLTSILSTYATVQQLYHKAVVPFLHRYPEYIDCPAGEL